MVLDSLNDSVAKLLLEGKIGVIPTDTVYGLVCKASNSEAVARLYQLKSREHKPGTVIAANIQQLAELGIPLRYVRAAEQFWPNPISVIVASTPELSYLDLGKMTLAVRVPKFPELIKLLNKTGPLLTSSANYPGDPEANNVGQAQKYFGDSVDFYADGGDLSGRTPSTLIRIIDDAVEILREGAVKVNEAGEIEK